MRIAFSLINIIFHLLLPVIISGMASYGWLETVMIYCSYGISALMVQILICQALRRKFNGGASLGLILILYFSFAYSLKFAITVAFPSESWVSYKIISPEQLIRILPYAYFTSTIGALFMLVGISFGIPHTMNLAVVQRIPRLMIIAAFSILGLIFKYYLKSRYNLGVPTLDPVQIGIPYATGILTLLIDYGFLFLSNIVFIIAVIAQRRRAIVIGMIILTINAIIDLMFGEKNTVMYQIFLLFVYTTLFKAKLPLHKAATFKSYANKIYIFASVLTLMIVSIYKYLNFFRYGVLADESSITGAALLAASSEVAMERSSLMSLLNRITGVEGFAAVQHLHSEYNFSATVQQLFDGSLLRRFSNIVLGGVDSTAAFSVTFFGGWYLVDGLWSMFIGSFVFGYFISIMQTVILRLNGISKNIKFAFLPLFWVMCIHQMLGGNPLIWIKSLLVTCVFIYLIGIISYKRSRKLTEY